MAETPLKSLGVRHAAFSTLDLDRAIAFYTDLLGFTPYHIGDRDWAMLQLGDTSLSLILSRTIASPTVGGGSHYSHLGLVVPTSADVDAWHARLSRAGVSGLSRPEEHRDGAYGFYLRDPDGNPLELIFIPLRSRAAAPPPEAWLVIGEGPHGDLEAALRAHVHGVRCAVASLHGGKSPEEAMRGLTGAPAVRVFPLALSTSPAIDRAVQALRALHPDVRFTVEPALGSQLVVREALLAAIVRSGEAAG